MGTKYKHIICLTWGHRFPYSDSDSCVNIICGLYPEGSPKYDRILEDIYFEGDTGANCYKIIEGIKENFPQKKLWKYRATKKLSQTGLYQAEFRHPLDIKTGSLDNLTSRQGNILRRVISKERNSEAYAEMIIDELNQILAEPDYWLGEGKNLALKKFREETINLFYTPTKPR